MALASARGSGGSQLSAESRAVNLLTGVALDRSGMHARACIAGQTRKWWACFAWHERCYGAALMHARLLLPVPFLALSFAAATACSSATTANGVDAGAANDSGTIADVGRDGYFAPILVDEALLTARPYEMIVPPSYDAKVAAPLLIGLHGYGDGDDGAAFEKYFQLAPIAAANGALYTHPDGIIDKNGDRTWNGTDACCDFTNVGTDDVAYLKTVVGDAVRKYNVDRRRIYVVGLSAGGVMAHRLACDAADVFAAVLSVSGTTWKDASKCVPTGDISIAEVHGEKDTTVKYGGGVSEGATYPSAPETASIWATLNGCTGDLTNVGRLDIDTQLAADETRRDAYEGCKRGAVELWTVEKGPHAPHVGNGFQAAVWDFLAKHPKP